jgi:GTP pyrophosphokinase
MQDKEEITIQDIIAKKKENTRKVDSKLIMRAYEFANLHHKDQCRNSGEPYIIHPLNVAYILAEIGLDDSTICAALLHE